MHWPFGNNKSPMRNNPDQVNQAVSLNKIDCLQRTPDYVSQNRGNFDLPSYSDGTELVFCINDQTI